TPTSPSQLCPLRGMATGGEALALEATGKPRPGIGIHQPHPLDAPWSIFNFAPRLQLSWYWPLLRLGASRPLSDEDVWPAPRGLSSKEIGRRVEECWRAELLNASKLGQEPRLARVFWSLTRFHTVTYIALSSLCGVFFILAPIILRAFLEELAQGAEVPALVPLGVGFSLCWAGISFSVSLSKYQAQLSGMICRLGTQRLIYCACLCLPADASSTESPTNLMSVDAERLFVAFNTVMPHSFVLVLAFPVLLITQLGLVPAAVCMASAVGTSYFSKWVGGRISRKRRLVMAESDRRLQLSEQFLEGIRVLKMNGWTGVAQKRLQEVRAAELYHQRRVLLWKGINLMMGLASPCVVGFCMFSSYALLGGAMTPEVIFPALTILRALQIMMGILPLGFSALADSATSHKRIYRFLLAHPLRPQAGESRRGESCPDGSAAGQVLLRDVTLVRGNGDPGLAQNSQHQPGGTGNGSVPSSPLGRAFRSLQSPRSSPASPASPSSPSKPSSRSGRAPFQLGPLNLSLRPGDLCVVCGPVGSGKSTLLLGLLGEVPCTPASGELSIVAGEIALCAQEPWIVSASLRESVRCLRKEDPAAYAAAVKAAQLMPDFASLPAADSTEIGSRGINISGGQKARVALARSVFSAPSADIVFLDDVLSAVDAHVARRIVEDALLGSLCKRTRILVANTFLPLILPHADCVVVLKQGGRVDVVAPPAQALATSAWLRGAVDTMGGCNLDELEQSESESAGAVAEQGSGPAVTGQREEAADGSLLVAEERSVGILSLAAYAAYFREATPSRKTSLGALIFGGVVVLALLAEALRTSTELWVTWWVSSKVAPLTNDGYWIGGYAAILLALLVVSIVRAVVFMRTVTSISGQTHGFMMNSILGASVPLFFDIVPTGRILNRLSKDLDSLDSQLPEQMAEFLQAMCYVLSSALVCVATSPYVLLALVPMLFVFVKVRKLYSASSRELKRLEAISRSPLYVHFQETLAGLVHIRAFRLQGRMLEEFDSKVDRNNHIFFHQYVLICWLVLRVNMIATVLITAVVAVSIFFRTAMDPTLIGLSLSSAAGLLGRLHMCVQLSAEVENHFTSVERLDHFSRVPQEEQSFREAALVEASWPERGQLVFEAVQLKYRPHLPLVLDGVSFTVPAGHRAGVIGRTGSGKSTCMLALLRLVELSAGRILLDGRDLSKIPLQLLRGHAVAIIPQDPYLFAGSVRENLDPLGLASSEELESALRSTQLTEDLDTQVHGRGSNFSVGQRQLLCVARALLRRARVVLLDEASANIDALTDARIQQTIRSCFGGSTLLIIAHRLSTIADADLVICMENGRAVEVGPPDELRRAGGKVADMFLDAGETMDREPLEAQPAGAAEGGRMQL
ncbi:unnamed protein product, partial [Polarella glacialis]